MKKYFPLLIILSLIICCHTNKNVVADKPEKKSLVADHTGDGTSIAKAVVIQEKKSESQIWVEEEAWLKERYAGYVLISNRSENTTGADGKQKLHNIYKIRTPDAAEFEVFFDISIFYNGQTK